MTNRIETNSALGGDTFVLALVATDVHELSWGGDTAILWPNEATLARAAIEADDLGACRRVFDSARGAY